MLVSAVDLIGITTVIASVLSKASTHCSTTVRMSARLAVSVQSYGSFGATIHILTTAVITGQGVSVLIVAGYDANISTFKFFINGPAASAITNRASSMFHFNYQCSK